ncbi:hypothetical protein B0H13DRAFT_2524200 [Mycena leptocephala]|nr:hypothetical protein B0H13DRAFT_2524200 [Mycena leptocephala]
MVHITSLTQATTFGAIGVLACSCHLWNLVDPPDGSRPCIPYPLLMQIAIYGSEAKTLTLQGIYRAIAERFTFFKEQDRMGIAAWRNSVRHALSLYSVFVKVPHLTPTVARDAIGFSTSMHAKILHMGGLGNARLSKKTAMTTLGRSPRAKKPGRASKPKPTKRRGRRNFEDTSDVTSVLTSMRVISPLRFAMDPIVRLRRPFSVPATLPLESLADVNLVPASLT